MKYILNMKRGSIILFSILIVFTAVYAGAFLEYFQGRSEGEDIRLEWKTGEEINLQDFKIERKTPNNAYEETIPITPILMNQLTKPKNLYSFTG